MLRDGHENFFRITTSDVDQVVEEWTKFIELAEQHYLGMFLQSACFKNHGHFDLETLSLPEKLAFIEQHQETVGYAVVRQRIQARGSRKNS